MNECLNEIKKKIEALSKDNESLKQLNKDQIDSSCCGITLRKHLGEEKEYKEKLWEKIWMFLYFFCIITFITFCILLYNGKL